ncbi:hypothetical protein CBS101457_000579 [Exobasidium rhododendri]|nr:hypothetical protein CBS101457_000579 [Exobasidium rhododendri]
MLASSANVAAFRSSDESNSPFDTHHQQQQQQQQQLSHFQQLQQTQQLYQNHLHALQSQSQLHTQQQSQENNPDLVSRQMLAAQQNFGFAMQQQQRDGQSSGTTPSGGWNDDSEMFLRNLLASNIDSPPSSISGASYIASSPSYVNGGSSVDENRNSLSPTSSTGYQSLHDFIHNNNFPTPPKSDADAYDLKPSMSLQQQQQAQQSAYAGHHQQQPVMDANALEYFVNSMVQGGDRQLTSAAGLDPSLVSPAYNMFGGASNFSFQPQMFGAQSLPLQQYQQVQHYSPPQQQQSLHPAIDSRKRSAPSAMTTEVEFKDRSSGAPRTSKKVRKESTAGQSSVAAALSAPAPKAPSPSSYDSLASAFLPRMEVGSNATALAAIERLKAKRRAEVEQRIKQEEFLASQPKKEGAKGGSRSSDEGHGIREPVQKNQKKVAHNAIERRYRNNINDRITALRNAVPALRELRPKKPGSSRKGKGAQEQDLVDGVPAATKLNKATILGKATEYIRYLKGRETRLVSEVAGLRELIRSLEGGEELLDLWEGEMEKVVAEQEAKAKAAFAMEDESFGFGGDDDDDEEEDEEDFDVKPSSRSSSGSSSSSSRYMMGIFMGFSVFGGGAELLSEHAAASSSLDQNKSIVRASSGRVFGASHQLLKRGMTVTNVKLGNVTALPHHFDHVPSHVLAVEVMRGLALLACLAFIFWPIVGRFIVGSPTKVTSRSQKKVDREAFALRRKEMLGALARNKPRPHEMDVTMRKFVGAPANAVQGGLALLRLAGREVAYRVGLGGRSMLEEEQAAVWCRLLELETSLGPLAHRSLLARLHTLLTVGTMSNVGQESKGDSELMTPARVHGTMAIAMVRAARGNGVVNQMAEKQWAMAKRCRLIANEEEEGTKDVQDRWLDNVLEHSLLDAIVLCPSPTVVASTFSPKVDSSTRASLLSPLASISAIQHSRQLTTVWGTLLGQIVESTCPPNNKSNATTVAKFMKHQLNMKIYLSLIATPTDQERLSSQISRLAFTSPKCENWQILSNVTFGTWALLIGNISVARSVAAALVTTGSRSELPASAVAFVRLVFEGNDAILATLPIGAFEAVNEVDALAAASLHWLQFLRLITATMKNESVVDSTDVIVEKALSIRRLLASARFARNVNEDYALSNNASTSFSNTISSHRDSLTSTASTASSISEETAPMTPKSQGPQLDDSLDTLTDILALLGRRAALGTLLDWNEKDGESEQHDSGVEWGT